MNEEKNIQNGSDTKKKRIQELFSGIQCLQQETQKLSQQRMREEDQRQQDIDNLRNKLSWLHGLKQKQEKLVNESQDLNIQLQSQIENTEIDQDQQTQVMSQMTQKISQLKDVRQSFALASTIHSHSLEELYYIEQNNEEQKKILQQAVLKVNKKETEIQFSKERLNNITKKYLYLKNNEKNSKELHNSIQKNQIKFDKQTQSVFLYNSSLQSEVQEFKPSLIEMKNNDQYIVSSHQQTSKIKNEQNNLPQDCSIRDNCQDNNQHNQQFFSFKVNQKHTVINNKDFKSQMIFKNKESPKINTLQKKRQNNNQRVNSENKKQKYIIKQGQIDNISQNNFGKENNITLESEINYKNDSFIQSIIIGAGVLATVSLLYLKLSNKF